MAFPTQSALLTNAGNKYLTAVDSASLSGTGDTTCETWVKYTTIPPNNGNEMGLMGHSNADVDQRAVRFGLDKQAGTVELTLTLNSNGTSGTNITKTVAWTPSTATWYHVAFSYNAAGGSAKFYVDGSQQGSTQTGYATSINNSTSVFTLGLQDLSDAAGNRTLDGRLVMSRYWTTERSQAQIAANMCVVLGSTSNLGGEWTLNNTLNDNSGNSNTLTNVNTVTFGADVPALCAVVGPALVKTWDAVTQSTGIKTYEGVALASVKTVIGVA